MQPVKYISDIENSYGAWGYSALVKSPFNSELQRKTLYMLRDGEGWTKHVLIMDAEEAF